MTVMVRENDRTGGYDGPVTGSVDGFDVSFSGDDNNMEVQGTAR